MGVANCLILMQTRTLHKFCKSPKKGRFKGNHNESIRLFIFFIFPDIFSFRRFNRNCRT